MNGKQVSVPDQMDPSHAGRIEARIMPLARQTPLSCPTDGWAQSTDRTTRTTEITCASITILTNLSVLFFTEQVFVHHRTEHIKSVFVAFIRRP
jgi:hypothetical protein